MSTLILPDPVTSVAELLPFSDKEMRLSCKIYTDCVIPGLDPLGDFKTCQDLVFTELNGEAVLMGLLDGHGTWGLRVAQVCARTCKVYFHSHIEECISNPSGFLVSLCAECQRKLTSSDSGVNCLLSGTTAVFAVMTKAGVFVASVGDSRAVLGTSVLPVPPVAAESRTSLEPDLMRRIRELREVIYSDIKAAPLSKDHKPDDPEEMERIVKSGGQIHRSRTDDGGEGGPNRVWRPNEPYPGLAMSRSLGDTIAHSLGVSSEPTVTHITPRPTVDKFLVLASDGVWDVMDDQDVCAFIDKHRAIAASEKPKHPDVVRTGEVPMAQLLCEEARIRWMSVIEAEDSVVDNISCVVLELAPKKVCEERPSRLELGDVVKARRSLLQTGSTSQVPEGPETPETGLAHLRTFEKSPRYKDE